MAFLQSIGQWLGSSKTDRRPELKQSCFRPVLEGMEGRLLLSSSPWLATGSPVLSGEWFVQSNGLAASISQTAGQLTLTNAQGQQTTGQWLNNTSFTAWGQTAQVIQDGNVTEILWNGNVWSQSTWMNGGLSGQWFVQSNGGSTTISQSGNQITLTNENGTQTTGQWLSPTSFTAWGQTAQVDQSGNITQILWNGNVWSQSTWMNGGLSGQWFVQSNGQDAIISQSGSQLTLDNENGTMTTGQWLSPTSFSAWGHTAVIVQNGPITQILWNGNIWSQSTWQNGGLSGQWFVQSNGLAASIDESGGQLTLTNAQGQQTTGQWLSATSFSAWGQTAQIVQNGPITQILWNGNVWSQSTWEVGGLGGQWFVQSDGLAASIVQSGTQLLLTNEQGQETVARWLSPTTFQAWGQTAQIVQNGSNLTQILWDGDVWTQSTWMNGGLTGQWFVQSNGKAASILESGNQIVLTNENGTQTTGQWVSPTSFKAWGQTVQIVQNGTNTQILWNGNPWSQSLWQEGGLSGQWFVKSNGLAAEILEIDGQLVLTNEHGSQTAAQWLSPTSFKAWGQTAHIVQNGSVTQIQWNGNVWSQSAWMNGGLAGQWTVQTNGLTAGIVQNGSQLVLTNEHGTQTTAQWLSPTSFKAWGQTAQIVQNGTVTQIHWNGNVWSQTTIGGSAPTSSVAALPAVEGSSSFTVAWSGHGNVGGSGIASYSIYSSDNGGAYTLFQQSGAAGSATFTGQAGHTYTFYSVATDHTGNVQTTPSLPQASTTIRLATSTAIISSAADSTVTSDQAITFTATVTTDPAEAVTPEGSVSFYNGSASLGRASLVNGQATFTPSSPLPIGQDTIKAVYDDASDTGVTPNTSFQSSSANLVQTINPSTPASVSPATA
jgi:Bacterial Ig-like domain (group 3)